jgi:hypothetical protein
MLAPTLPSTLVDQKFGRLSRKGMRLLAHRAELQMAEGEMAEFVDVGYVDGVKSLVVISDRQLLVAIANLRGTCRSVPYRSITQVENSALTLKVIGAGVRFEVKRLKSADAVAARVRGAVAGAAATA